jgi:hypothetical protein
MSASPRGPGGAVGVPEAAEVVRLTADAPLTDLAARDGLPRVLAVSSGEPALEVIVSEFSGSRLVAFVSDLGKVGCALDCRHDDKASTFSVEVLLGDREDPWSRLLGRQMVAAAGGRDVLLLGSLRLRGLDEAAAMAKVRRALELFKSALRGAEPVGDTPAPPKPSW